MSEKTDIPMIPKHQHQAEMMHLSRTIHWLVIAIIIGFLSMLGTTAIFVNGYTSRTEKWLQTYNTLMERTAVTEVANEKEETGVLQQLPLP